MNQHASQSEFELGPDGRPDFLVKLGVLLPCTPEDVKQAYLSKVRAAHPDVGGSQEAFLDLQQAFERATEYAHFVSGRRKWLGAQIERYVAQEAAVAQIVEQGGAVKYEHKEWLSREIGEDFTQVLDIVSELKWPGAAVGDAQVDWLLAHRDIFRTIRVLDLSNSQVTDDGVCRLGEFTSLERLILRGTGVTHRCLEVLDALASLTDLDVRDTGVGAMRLYFVRRSFPNVQIQH